MALSGNFVQTFGPSAGEYDIYCTWTGSQNIANNTTTIELKTYLRHRWGISISSRTDNTTTIDGSLAYYNSSAYSSGTLGSQTAVLMNTRSRTITHDSDGTKSLTMSSMFKVRATLDGSYVGDVTASSGTITLDTIPRASTVTSSASWTAPNARSVTISRASSSFTHKVWWETLDDDGTTWRTIKYESSVGTSHSGVFTLSENTDIFNSLNGRSSCSSRIRVQTMSGSTEIGDEVIVAGTCTAVTASIIGSSAYNFDMDDTAVEGTITKYNSDANILHTVVYEIWNRNTSTYVSIETLTSLTTSSSWTIGETDRNTMYSYSPSHTSTPVRLTLSTYYNSVLIREARQYTGTATITNANPTFSTISYEDINSTTYTLTGNDQAIIQNHSQVRAIVASADRAQTVKGAGSIVRYVATLTGVEKIDTSTSGDINFDFGTVNVSYNITLSIKAEDSRGYSTTVSQTVTIVPYTPPVIDAAATRTNNFESETTITNSGSFSRILVGGTQKNSISSSSYRIREVGTEWADPESWTSFSLTSGTGTYTTTDVVTTLDNSKAWEIEIKTVDALTDDTIVSKTVSVGTPILFIDSALSSLGLNCYPTLSNTIEVAGDIDITGSYKIDGTALAASDVGAEPTLTKGTLTVSSPLSITNSTRQLIGGAAEISHLSTAGNKHVPTGGATGQFLKYGGSSGTASWATPTQSDVGAIGMRAWLTSDQTLTGNAANYILFDDTSGNGFQDTGISYSSSTGVFTLTDGVWYINTHISLGSTVVGKYYIARLVSGSSNTELVRLAAIVAYSTGNLSINGSTLRLVSSSLGYTYRIAVVPQTDNISAIGGSPRTYLEIFKVR